MRGPDLYLIPLLIEEIERTIGAPRTWFTVPLDNPEHPHSVYGWLEHLLPPMRVITHQEQYQISQGIYCPIQCFNDDFINSLLVPLRSANHLDLEISKNL